VLKLLALLLSVSIFASEIPFDANIWVTKSKKDETLIYSTRLKLVEFHKSKIFTIIEQEYDMDARETVTNINIYYKYYWNFK